jgi:hypothetical protein
MAPHVPSASRPALSQDKVCVQPFKIGEQKCLLLMVCDGEAGDAGHRGGPEPCVLRPPLIVAFRGDASGAETGPAERGA